MTESFRLRDLLLPELEAEFARTRKALDHLPENVLTFQPHLKSMTLAKLAGHTAQVASFPTMILTSPDVDIATAGRTPLLMESRPQLLAAFDDLADKSITALKHTSDEVFDQHWKLSRGPMTIFSGTRYNAYRTFALNHLIHHRAQLGVYTRLNECPVPSIYGPSADESN